MVEHEICIVDVQLTNVHQLYDAVMYRNLWGIFPAPYLIYATEKSSEGKRAQASTNKLYLIKCLVSV